ncbi:MAG TPA: hypothetical protein ENI20_10415 [Bacteroides sp.]|nr:hypothetical protein [Bacteroides sp.]
MEQKIKTIIRQVGDIGEKLSNILSEEALPSIEKDIILRDIRLLYEAVKNLEIAPVVIPDVKPSQPESVPGEMETVSESPVPEPEITVPEEEILAKEQSTVEEKPTVTAEPEKTEPAVKPAEPATLGDKFKSDKKFINESLAGNKQDVGSKIQSTPINNIGSALGINDRFKLINDLFKGDKDSFQNTIGVLDGASNFNEAFNYITTSFDWDMEEDSVQLLLELVRRKFIVNQNE